MASNPSAFLSGLLLQATTGGAGFALQNGTPTVLSWTAPNDGNAHRVIIPMTLNVSSAQTGGLVNVTYDSPNGVPATVQAFAGGQAGGTFRNPSPFTIIVQGGAAVTVSQGSALSAGAAQLWAEIWGS